MEELEELRVKIEYWRNEIKRLEEVVEQKNKSLAMMEDSIRQLENTIQFWAGQVEAFKYCIKHNKK